MKTRCLRGHRLPQKQGFTLVELMVGLVILAVLLAIAVPSMREFIARKRVEGVATELATDMRYLRAQQLQRGGQVSIRFGSNDSLTCYTLVADGGGDWCDCTLGAGQACAGTNNVEIKTGVFRRSSGVVVVSTPAAMRITLGGLTGLPSAPLLASVSSSLGGEVRVSANSLASPSLCSVSGHESSLKACP